LVVDDTASLHIGHRLARQTAALLFLVDPGAERLFDNPAARALKAGGQLVNPVGQGPRYVCGERFGFGLSHWMCPHKFIDENKLANYAAVPHRARRSLARRSKARCPSPCLSASNHNLDFLIDKNIFASLKIRVNRS
jgi:hypothetical protein